MTVRRPLALALSVGLAAGLVPVALGGCGGSGPTRADVDARGNAICTAANRAVRAAAPPGTAISERHALGAYAAKIGPIVARELADLRSLPRPADRRDELDAYLAALAAVTADLDRIAAGDAHGDTATAARSLAAIAASPAAVHARAYGLTACAGAGATVGSG